MLSVLKKGISALFLSSALVASSHAGIWENGGGTDTIIHCRYTPEKTEKRYNFIETGGFIYPNFENRQETKLHQGWKIHISLNTNTLEDIEERKSKILDAILPIIFPPDAQKIQDFKIASNRTLTDWHKAALEGKTLGKQEDGKFITIYQTEKTSLDDLNMLLKALDTALGQIKQEDSALFKNIAGEIKVGNTEGLYVRYGVLSPRKDLDKNTLYFKLKRENETLSLVTPGQYVLPSKAAYSVCSDNRAYPLPEVFGQSNFKPYVEKSVLNLFRGIKGVSWNQVAVGTNDFIKSWAPPRKKLRDIIQASRDGNVNQFSKDDVKAIYGKPLQNPRQKIAKRRIIDAKKIRNKDTKE